MCGKPPTFLFQQDGASSHTSNATQDYLAAKFPKFLRKGNGRRNSEDLNPLDFFAWWYLQAQAGGGERPKCLDALNVAITHAAGGMPLEMAQRR